MDYLPHLSWVTGSVEILAAAWAFSQRRNHPVVPFAAALLAVLGIYQFLEVFVCASPDATVLARLAFADVAWLPPLGIWMVVTLSSPRGSWPWRGAMFFLALAVVFTLGSLFVPGFVNTTTCQVVFARYIPADGAVLYFKAYGLYYDVGLATMVFGTVWALATTDHPLHRRLLADFLTGSLLFILGALATMLAFTDFVRHVPSVMCHLALLLAVMLVRMVWRVRDHPRSPRT
jgi:hypothetical protein